MKYYEYSPSSPPIGDVLAHLRNKNLMIVEDAPSTLDRALRQAARFIAAVRARRLLARWGTNAKFVVSEQVVENAVVLTSLRPDDRRVLDFGGYESLLPLQLAALGREVWVLDQRRYPFAHPNLRTLCADVLRDPLDVSGSLDVVISISTIEHVGLGRYGDLVDPDGDRHAVERLWKLLRTGGRLILSVPAGKPATQRGYRVYDAARLSGLLPAPAETRWFMKEQREGTWSEVGSHAVAELRYDAPLAEAPVQGVVVAVCEKPF
jgi:2-polyprenyl-3-methyl-5-hydroxy-6-metoxy-1,4-benzoquinol methylase